MVCGKRRHFREAHAPNFHRDAASAKAGVIRFETFRLVVIPQVCGISGNFRERKLKENAAPADINQRVADAFGGVLDDCALVLFRGCAGYITLELTEYA
jgi:hypothetical protein